MGCGSVTHNEEDSEVEGNVEIFSWWLSGGEREALETVLDLYQDEYPRATVTNASTEPADKAREELRDRMAEGLPPDTFQANTGADLLNNWVLINAKDDAESKVESLQEIAAERGWLEAFDPEVLEAATYKGKLWALPVNVHRINSLVIRKDLFEKHELSVPKTMDELFALCDRIMHDDAIQAEAPEGERMACLGLGNQYDWTLSQMTFEMILPAMTSATYYEQFWMGRKSGDSKEIIEAMEAALYLYCGGTDTSDCKATSYFNSDVDDIDWYDGVLKVADKRAMMAAMGDWAKGFLESRQQRPGKDFDIVPFPGSEDTFVFTSDTFPLPKGARNRAGALALLETFASVEGQVTFNKLKGSIPARSVGALEMDQFDSVSLATLEDFRHAERVLALSGLLASSVMPFLAAELKASMQHGSTEIIQNYVRANYDSIPSR
jgi:glucose/mannose transport system substrate-binding protein